MAHEGESRFFRAWASFVLRLRPLFGLLIVSIMIGAVYQVATKLRLETSPEYFAQGNSDAYETLNTFRDDFGRDDMYLVLVEGDVFTTPFLDRLRTLHGELEGLQVEFEGSEDEVAPTVETETTAAAEDDWGEGEDWGEDDWGEDAGWDDTEGGSVIEDVTSLINYRQTEFSGGAIQVRGLLDDPPAEAELTALRAKVLADKGMVGNVIGAEGKHAVLAVRSQLMTEDESREVQRTLEALVTAHDAPGFEIAVTGMPALETSLSTTLLSDMRRLGAGAFALMGIVLFVLFRHPAGVIAPLMVSAMSIAWTLAAMATLGVPVTLISNIIPAFLICVGLGDSVHVMSVYRDLKTEGMNNHDAIVSAVGSTGMPVLFTTLTTMVGLLSFRFASTQGIQEMGTAAAFGVFCAFALSVTLIPLALSGLKDSAMKRPPEKADNDFVDQVLQFCTRLSATRAGRQRVGIGAVFAVIIACVGISQVDVYHNPLDWLSEDDPVRRSMDTLDDHIGGASNFVVVVENDSELGVKDRELLLGLEALDAHVRGFIHPRTNQTLVSSTMSLVDIVKETNRALHEGDEASYALPADQRGVSDALLLFENAGPDDLRRIATADLRKTHLTARIDWMDATAYLPLKDHIEEGVATLLPKGSTVTAKPTGTVYSLVTVVGALIGDMLLSFGVAAGIIVLMMVFLLRRPSLGLIAMIPNLLPVAFILAFMGFMSIPIDLATLLIASIVIGIAVDDTIHYMHQYRVTHDATGDRERSLQRAIDHAGRAIVSTSLILALGFSVYLASSMANIRRFGLLVAMACVFALFTNLILVPALLRTLHGDARATA